MRIERRLGDRLRIETLAVQGLSRSVHLLLENDLSIAWKRINKNTNHINPLFKIDKGGWCAVSTTNGEKIALFSIVPPKRGRPRP